MIQCAVLWCNDMRNNVRISYIMKTCFNNSTSSMPSDCWSSQDDAIELSNKRTLFFHSSFFLMKVLVKLVYIIRWTNPKSEALKGSLLLAVMVQSVCQLGSLVLGTLVSSKEEELEHTTTNTMYLKQEAAYLRKLLKKHDAQAPKSWYVLLCRCCKRLNLGVSFQSQSSLLQRLVTDYSVIQASDESWYFNVIFLRTFITSLDNTIPWPFALNCC